MQIIESPKEYDVIIVGSGAGGGMATKVLADAGLKVAVVEAGPFFDPKDPKTMTQLKWPYESPRRGASTDRAFGEWDMSWGDWEVEGEPYTHEPGTDFKWWRSRMLGGRTNHWGRISLRFGPKDFKGKTRDGHGEDWPIGYEDVKPYYDKVDKLIGGFGTNEGLPNDPDGFFLPPPKPRLHELFYIDGARKTGIPVIPSRMSMLTKRINTDRGVWFYCGQCSRSCSVYADFSSGSCLIFPAQKNGGQVELFVNCMVREVTTDEEGRATGVSYINKEDRKEYKIKGKVMVLAASACSSARILLNSKSKQHPNGLGNSSDLVGKYLHDSTGASAAGFIPGLMNRKTSYNEDGVGGMHVYSPWWGDNSQLDFPRGYHIEVWGGMGQPNYGFGFNVNDFNKFGAMEFSITFEQPILGLMLGGDWGNATLYRTTLDDSDFLAGPGVEHAKNRATRRRGALEGLASAEFLTSSDDGYTLSGSLHSRSIHVDNVRVITEASIIPTPGATALVGLAGLVGLKRRRKF